MKITIVTPVYNEEKRVGLFLKQLRSTKYKIVVVDDGSTDASLKQINKIKNKNTTLLEHKINLGKGAALKTGCEYAFKEGADAVILMDSDGQHNVNDLSIFEKKLRSGKYDIVLGSRNLNLGIPLDRYVGNKIASVFVSLLFRIYVSDIICGFRGLTKKAYKKINWESTGYGVETEMVVNIKRNGLTYCEVPVETIYYNSFKGVTIWDSIGVFGSVMKWKVLSLNK